MINFILKIYDKMIERRWMAWLIVIALFSVSLFASLNLDYREDIADFLPVTKENKKYTSVFNNLGGQNRILLIFSGSDIDSIACSIDEFVSQFNSSSLKQYSENLSAQIDESSFLDIIDLLNENYLYFLSDSDYNRADSLLSDPDYIRTQLENNKQLLMLPTGGIMTGNLRYDPLHLFSPVIQRLQTLKASNDYEVLNGYLYNKDRTKGLVFFASPFGVSESKENQKVVTALDSIINNVERVNPDISISSIGAPVIAVTNASQIKRDSILGLVIAVVLIVSLLVYSFRRLDDLFWIMVSILFGWLFALSMISLFSDNISIIVVGIGSIIIGIAVNYPLHYLDHIKHELDKRTALKEMITPLLIGNITTVSAFLCLVLLDAKAMRGLGLFGAFTLIGTILFVLIFLPILVKPRSKGRTYFNLDFTTGITLSKGVRTAIFILFIILTSVFSYFSFKTSFDSNIQNINYSTPEQKRDLKELAASMESRNGKALLYAVAQGESLNEAVYNNERLLSNLQNFESAKISGINGFLPSKDRQQNRIDRWRGFWAEHSNIISDFKRESTRQGFSAKAFDPFLSSINREYAVNELDYFEPLLNLLNETYIQHVDSLYRVVNFVNIEIDSLNLVKGNINTPDNISFFAFDSSDVSNQLVKILSDSFNYIGFLCGFVVFFFLWISFGRLELSLISFLPLTVSWFWILGIMYLTDVQFNIVNIILATLIFGQGDDYTIFITEGMMYEYAYGKKRLKSYKNSIAISALIMLIGIGALIFAKHPALQSLAIVSIIGMLTVLIMTYYIPPLIFRWITTSKGVVRSVPITIKRLLYSLYSIGFFIISVYLFMYPVMFLFFKVFKVTERSKLRYHKIISCYSKFVIKRVPGVKFSLNNRFNESFEKPSVIVANHQSHLDLMCLLMLSEKIIILTNDWVWNNPLYGKIIKYAEFYPVSNGVENNLDKLKSLADRGYSIVVFPEGTRSEDCSILRFHKGAFYLAQYLNADIVPVVIHGAGDLLPKSDFMLREGEIYVEVQGRIPVDEFKDMDCRELTQNMRRFFRHRYAEIVAERGDARYYSNLVRYKYMYKGRNIELNCSRELRRLKSDSVNSRITVNSDGVKSIALLNSGNGEMAWLYALVNRKIQIYGFETDNDRYLISANTSAMPSNLHFVYVDEYESISNERYDMILDVNDLK